MIRRGSEHERWCETISTWSLVLPSNGKVESPGRSEFSLDGFSEMVKTDLSVSRDSMLHSLCNT